MTPNYAKSRRLIFSANAMPAIFRIVFRLLYFNTYNIYTFKLFNFRRSTDRLYFFNYSKL